VIHLTIQQISTYFDGELGESSATLVRQHFEFCDACARKYAALEAQGRALDQALAAEPGDPFFRQLTSEIAERIRPERVKSAAARAVPRPDAPPAPPAPPADALAGDRNVPPEEDPEPLIPPAGFERPAGRRSGAPFAWAAVLLMGIVAAGAGVMYTRTEHAGPGRPAVLPKHTDPVAPTPTAPPADVGTAPDTASEISQATESPSPPPPRPVEQRAAPSTDSDPEDFEPVPTRGDEALVGLAGKLPRVKAAPSPARSRAPARSAAGDREPAPEPAPSGPTVADYEASAARWEETLPTLRGDDYRQARFRLAEARYLAWRLEPSGDRATRAEAAIRSYLVTAPGSLERDEASLWLSRVEEAGFR